MRLQAGAPAGYLGADDIIETAAPEVMRLSTRLRAAQPDDERFARAAFEWVRDRITHSLDARDHRLTLTATQVLAEGTGLCFAKSHLLVALLRSQGVPAGLCYQRLRDGDSFVLHGLVAVRLGGGWHRLDPRGNRAGLETEFSLVAERLAFTVDTGAGEVDYAEVYPCPAPVVVRALRGGGSAVALCDGGLPTSL
jgi:transglutaminase-like putative cysteine protease